MNANRILPVVVAWSLGALVALSAATVAAVRSVTGPAAQDLFDAGRTAVGPVEFWAADRDASTLVGLDADLFVARRIALPWPVRVVERPGGGVWAVSAVAGDPLGAHRIVRYAADGQPRGSLGIDPPFDVARADDGLIAVVLTAPATRALIHVDDGLTPRTIASSPDDLGCTAIGTSVYVGTESGVVRRHDLATGAVASAPVGTQIGDLAPGPGGRVFVLDVGAPARLALVDPDLTVVWAVPVGLAAQTVVPIPDQERVWLADTTAARARRFGPDGVLELDVTLPLSGLDRGVAAANEHLYLTAPGAVLHVDPSGTLAPGQGGFDYLVDIVHAP